MEIKNQPSMEIAPKTYPCKIYSKWMWGLENAEISITSPKGGTATVSKWNFDECTEEQRELVWKIYNHTQYSEVRWEWGGNAHGSDTIELTIKELQLFHDAALASKGRVIQAWKPNSLKINRLQKSLKKPKKTLQKIW